MNTFSSHEAVAEVLQSKLGVPEHISRYDWSWRCGDGCLICLEPRGKRFANVWTANVTAFANLPSDCVRYPQGSGRNSNLPASLGPAFEVLRFRIANEAQLRQLLDAIPS